MRVGFRLVEGDTGIVIWATGLDLPSDADFAQWDQIVTATSSAIETAVLEAEQRRLLARKYENTRIWELFARASWHFTRARFDDNELAKALLERAIQLDPTFSPAHQWLAYTHIQYGNHFRTCSVARACGLAEPAAFMALDMDGRDAGSYSSLGFVAKAGGDARRGLACAEQALALNHHEGDALRLKGGCLIALGDHEEGAQALKYSTRIRPQDPQNWRAFEHLASSAHMQGDYDAAVSYAYEAQRHNQSQTASHPWLISALARLGRVAEARDAIAKARLSKGPRPFDECARYRPLYLAEEHHARVLEGMRMAGWRH